MQAKRLYREMYILRCLRHEEVICLCDVIMPPSFEEFRDLYLVSKCMRWRRLWCSDEVATHGASGTDTTNNTDSRPVSMIVTVPCRENTCNGFGVQRLVT